MTVNNPLCTFNYRYIIDLIFFLANFIEFSNFHDVRHFIGEMSSNLSSYQVLKKKNFFRKLLRFLTITKTQSCFFLKKKKQFPFFRPRPSPGAYMITVTVLSVSLNARKFFEFQLNKDSSDYETTSLMEYPPYIVFSNTWQELIVTGALPFLLLIICNIQIYFKILESSKHEKYR